MTREAHYNETFDSQRDFRLIMDGMARPGEVRVLDAGKLEPPSGFHGASALVAFCLLDSEVSHHCSGFPADVSDYLRRNTSSPETKVTEADFVFLADASRLADLAVVKTGELEYPELAATVVLQVTRLEGHPFEGSLIVTTSGPGVDGSRQFHVAGLDAPFLTLLRNINEEFPLGLDLILTAGEKIVCLPRSQRLEWERR